MKIGTHIRDYVVLEYTARDGVQYRRTYPTLESARGATQYPDNKRRKYYRVRETLDVEYIDHLSA